MSLEPGSKLGPYEIVAPLGAGGMGEVYRAKDTRLDRTVAIKVLPSHIASDPDARQRFEREARAVSSLNHPHICTLHDIGHQDGVDYLVMEHIEGETLADHLKKGALSLDRALQHGTEIADALDKAHRQGVVHRDLKPGNIMLTKSGAKLLDFGLAKLQQGPSGAPAVSQLATEAKPLTEKGTVLGTFQYMSPEQLEGKEADARTDIFAFGAVLYELFTGVKAFRGESRASLISAIMSSDPPPISDLQPTSPPLLDRIARRCLEKDPEERWQSAKDLAAELRWIGERAARTETPRAKTRIGGIRARWTLLVAALATIVALGLVVKEILQSPAEKRVTQFAIYPPEGTTFSSWRRGEPVISPDGSRIAFSAIDDVGESIWIRSLDSLDSRPLDGTEEGMEFFWSPDSQHIAFSSKALFRRVDVGGGPTQILSEEFSQGGTWNRNGDILFAQLYSPIHRLSPAGGISTPLTKLEPSRHEIRHGHPQFLPDGEHFLFFLESREAEHRGTYVASLSSPESKKLVLPGLNAAYADPGYLLFAKEGSLFARLFDVDRLEVIGDSLPLAEKVAVFEGRGFFSTSTDEVLAYKLPSYTQLTWFDRQGNSLDTLQVPEGAQSPEFSPDGNKVAFERYDPTTGTRDVWLYELSRGMASRFTFDPFNDSDPVWSPDGRLVIFSSSRDGYPSLYRKDADGAGEPEMILQAQGVEDWPMSWSPDGQNVIYNRWSSEASTGKLLLLPLSGKGEPTLLLDTDFPERQGQFSPDGKWVSYTSNESGRYEVYVQPFPRSGAKWRISTEGGSDARWRGDGKEIFYLGLDDNPMAVELSSNRTSLQPSTPRRLFQMRSGGPRAMGLRFRYAVRTDGERFLMSTGPSETRLAPIVVVLNWTALLGP